MKHCFMIFLWLLLSISLGQTGREINLSPAMQSEFIEFPEGSSLQEYTFTIPQAEALIVTLSPSADINLSLQLPSGDIVTTTNAATFGAEFVQEVFPPNELLLPEGEVQLIALELASAGTYTLNLDASNSTTVQDNGFVLAEISVLGATDEIFTGIDVSGSTITPELGDNLIVTTLVFQNGQGFVGATVTGRIVDPNGEEVSTLTFRDDGVFPDGEANDGLYSSTFRPSEAGGYLAVVDIQAETSPGLILEGREIADFTVFPANARLTGNFSDTGVDSDGDGFFDEVQLSFGTSGSPVSGEYKLYVTLETPEGTPLTASTTDINLLAGDDVAVSFPADDLKTVSTDGMYEVQNVVFMYEQRLLDRLTDLGGITYQIDELERNDTLILSLVSDVAVDNNDDDLFDLLEVTFSVDTLLEGRYGVSANLQTQDGITIDAAGLASVDLVQGSQDVTISFSGGRIKASEQDGPYLVTNVLVYPLSSAEGTALVDLLGETEAYDYTTFSDFIDTEAGGGNFDTLTSYLNNTRIRPQFLKQSLIQKAEDAQTAFLQGNLRESANLLSELRLEIRRYTNRGIARNDAVELIAIIDSLLILVSS